MRRKNILRGLLCAAVLLGAAYLLFTVLPPLGGPFTDPADVSALAPIPY